MTIGEGEGGEGLEDERKFPRIFLSSVIIFKFL